MRTIETPRLVLEPQTAAHAEEMFACLRDPAIYEFENEMPASLEALRERFRKLETRRSKDGGEQWLNWVARTREGSTAVGYVQATVRADGNTLVAYEFNSAWWGQGLAHEAVTAVIGELRAAYRAQAIGAVFKRANFRSRKLLHRLGMQAARADEFPAGLAEADEDAMVIAPR